MKALLLLLPILLLGGCVTGSGVVNINYKAIQDSQDSQINQSTSATLEPLK